MNFMFVVKVLRCNSTFFGGSKLNISTFQTYFYKIQNFYQLKMKAVVLFLPRPLKLDSPYDAKTSHHYLHHFRAHIFFTNMFSCERKKLLQKMSKHQEVSSTPVTKVKQIIVVL